MQSLGAAMHSMIEMMKDWTQSGTEVLVSDEDESKSNLLDLTGRLGTRMKCFQREVEATDKRIAKAKKIV